MRNCTILVGDVMTRLRAMRTESVHCIVTSPPYFGLCAYKTEPQVWGGEKDCVHLWIAQTDFRNSTKGNEGSTLAGPAITGKRFDSTSAFCSRCNAWKGEVGLEPTIELYLEHIVMIFEELRRLLRKDGSCWLNIADSYAGSWGAQSREHAGKHGYNVSALSANQVKAAYRRSHTGSIRGARLKPKDKMLVPERLSIALQDAGWWVRSRIEWIKDAPMPESTRDRPTTSYEDVYLLTKRAKYFYDEFAVREDVTGNTHPPGNRNNPKQGQAEFGTRNNASFSAALIEVVSSRNLRNVWHIPAEPHSDCLCNVCGRYYENPRGLKREKLDVDTPARGPRDLERAEQGLVESRKFGHTAGWRDREQKMPGGWAAGDRAHTELDGNYGQERLGKIICECGASDWTQHFAAYPTKLVDICVKAGTSEKGVCPQCLAPWVRVLDEKTPAEGRVRKLADAAIGRQNTHMGSSIPWNPTTQASHFGQSCKCEPAEPISATVLDCFGGLGTTAISALRLGRDAILIELQPQYARMAEIRVTQDAPLFNRVTVNRPEEPAPEVETALAEQPA